MPDSTVIAEVSSALESTLESQLVDGDQITEGAIGLNSPVEADNLRLSLYLYRIVENGTEKNAPPASVGPETTVNAPLSLDLYYLLTAYPGGTPDTGNGPHVLLGKAMQAFHDNPVVRNIGEDEDTYVSLFPQTMEELADIWSVFGETTFHPSVVYLVSPVRIHSGKPRSVQPVVERRIGDDGGDQP